jgi:archaellum biogenesis ATPase FlaH
MDGTPRVLYNLPSVLASDLILIVEGEKDVHTATSLGFVATTNPGGASAWTENTEQQYHYSTPLKGKRVVIIPDNDQAGRKHAESVRRILSKICTVSTLSLPDLPEKGDLTDWVNAGGTTEKLTLLINPPTGIEYLDLEHIAAYGVPDIEWLIPGWLTVGDIVVIAGRGGIGKSTLIADLAVACATPRLWCGLLPEQETRVLYFDEEQGEADLSRLFIRLNGINPNLRVASGQGIRLDDPQSVEKLDKEISAHKAQLVCFDSLQQVIGGTDENSAHDVGLIYNHLFKLRDKYKCAFIGVHHTRKSSTNQGKIERIELIRGSTAFVTQSSAAWICTQYSRDTMDLHVEKRRGGAPKLSMRIQYQSNNENDPIRLTSIGNADPDTALESCSESIMDLLGKRDLSRKEIWQAVKSPEITSKTLDRTLAHLFKIGSIHKPKYGIYSLLQPLTQEDIEY